MAWEFLPYEDSIDALVKVWEQSCVNENGLNAKESQGWAF